MKKTALPLLLLTFLISPPAAAQIGLGFGFGAAPFGGDPERVRIGQVARGKITEYLQQDFNARCKGGAENSKLPDICQPQRPYYVSSNLPRQAPAVDAALLPQLGFVYPGTQYRQIGYSVYLVRLPDMRIYDIVSLWDDGWK